MPANLHSVTHENIKIFANWLKIKNNLSFQVFRAFQGGSCKIQVCKSLQSFAHLDFSNLFFLTGPLKLSLKSLHRCSVGFRSGHSRTVRDLSWGTPVFSWLHASGHCAKRWAIAQSQVSHTEKHEKACIRECTDMMSRTVIHQCSLIVDFPFFSSFLKFLFQCFRGFIFLHQLCLLMLDQWTGSSHPHSAAQHAVIFLTVSPPAMSHTLCCHSQ